MSDAAQISNTFSNPDIAVPEFTKAQWEYITDNNGGAYSTQLNFLTSQIRNKFTDLHNSEFAIPAVISSSDTTRPYQQNGSQAFGSTIYQTVIGNPGASIAWKVSVLSFITNLLLQTDNSYTITTESNMNIINMIRLIIEHDIVWVEQEGPFIGYAPDEYPNGVDGAQGYSNSSQFFQPVTSNGNSFKSGSANVGATLNGSNTITTPISTGLGAGSNAIGNVNLLATPHVPISNNINPYDFVPQFTTGQILGDNSGGTYIAPASTPAKAPLAASGTFATTAVGAYTMVGGPPPNPVYNKGFHRRVQIFYQTAQQPVFQNSTASPTSGTYFPNQPVIITLIIIPTKLITDIFMQIKFPMYNLGFNVALTFAQSNEPGGLGSGPNYLSASQSPFPPWMTDNQERVTEVLSTVLSGTTGAVPAVGRAPIINPNFSGYENDFLYNTDFTNVNVPRLNGVGQGVPGSAAAGALSTRLFTMHQPNTAAPVFRIAFGAGYSNVSAPRFLYRNVTYSADETEKLVQRIAAGYSQVVNFTTCEYYVPTNTIINWAANGTNFTHTITNSVVMPLRVWMILPLVGQMQRSDISPMTIVGQITNCNLYVNATPYYSNPMITPLDFYNILKEQFGINGSILTYAAFNTWCKIYCFDLTRLQDRLSVPTEPVLLQIQASRNDMPLVGIFNNPLAANKSGSAAPANPPVSSIGGDYLQTRRYLLGQESIVLGAADTSVGQGGGMAAQIDIGQMGPYYAVQPIYLVERQNRVKFTFTAADAKLEVGNLGAL